MIRVVVRYHPCTALVVVGCEHPKKLAGVVEALRERLADENPYVQGRAASICSREQRESRLVLCLLRSILRTARCRSCPIECGSIGDL